MDAGAYFIPYATQFSFPRAAVVLLNRDAARVIRRHERFEDLVACDLPPPA